MAVSGDSDSDNQALAPNEDVSLNTIIPAAPAALDPSSDLIPFSRYFKNQRVQHQQLHPTRKVKRFPGRDGNWVFYNENYFTKARAGGPSGKVLQTK